MRPELCRATGIPLSSYVPVLTAESACPAHLVHVCTTLYNSLPYTYTQAHTTHTHNYTHCPLYTDNGVKSSSTKITEGVPSCGGEWSIERATALGRAAHAGDLLVLDGELVVVGDLLVHVDVALRVDNNLLLRLHGDDLGIAVGLKG